jgi:hypothetical protein
VREGRKKAARILKIQAASMLLAAETRLTEFRS